VGKFDFYFVFIACNISLVVNIEFEALDGAISISRNILETEKRT